MKKLLGLLALLEVVERAEPDRLLRGLPLRVGGQQDHLRRVGLRPRRLQDVQSVAVGHPQIGHHQVERLLGQPLRRARDTVGLLHAMPAPAKQERERRPSRRLVVDDEQVRHRHAASMGNRIVTRVPPPGAASMSMRPPCAVTIRSAIVRPRPLPFGFAE